MTSWQPPSPRAALLAAGLTALFALTLVPVGCSEPEPPPPRARLGVEPASLELPFPEWRTVRLSWQRLESGPAPEGLAAFVHLLDSDGELMRTFDQPLGAFAAGGDEIVQEVQLYQSFLGPPLEPGEYALTVGLYDRQGERWPLETAGESLGRFEYRAATVTVPPLSPEAPALTFSGAWLAPEPSDDKQILVRRWLAGSGEIRIQNLEVPGSLWVRIHVPPPAEGRPLLPPDSAAPPTFEVTSDCSGVTRSFDPPGHHDFVIPVYPNEGGEDCRVSLTPHYSQLPDPPDSELRLAAVEIVAWSAATLE